MSGTRSHFRKARATEPAAIIVGHGSPSHPDEQEAAIKALADQIAGRLPGWLVIGATLAQSGALESAFDAVGDRSVLVYPLFMADGWFVRCELARRLKRIDRQPCSVLAPLGRAPQLPRACADHAVASAAAAGFDPARTTLLVAAHGSRSDPRPKRVVEAVAAQIAAFNQFRQVRIGLVEEAPRLVDAARTVGPAICLPFFAARARHVTTDVPLALNQAGFAGLLLDPVGTLDWVPDIIADALRADLQQRRVA